MSNTKRINADSALNDKLINYNKESGFFFDPFIFIIIIILLLFVFFIN